MAWIAGVDGCRGGWIAAIAENGGESRFLVAPTLAALLAGRDPPLLLAIDMPIGLPDRTAAGGRGPEQMVRPMLGTRQSSVFAIPARSAVFADEYRAACDLALATSQPPRKVSKQGFHLFPKIRQLDGLLRSDADLRSRVRESHPELVFRLLAGAPLAHPKKIKGVINPAGMAERRALLVKARLDPALVTQTPPRGAAADDALDALACLICAREIAAGRGRPFPDPPGRDSHGLSVAIWGFRPAGTEDDR